MIEVEKQFVIDKGSKQRLLDGAQFIKTVQNHDTYYDSVDYRLTTQDKWLRKRNGKFELKISVNDDHAHASGHVLQYRELDTEDEIRQELHISEQGMLEQDLTTQGYHPYVSWVVTRHKYQKEEFVIDVDSVDFGYEQVEIELMVDDDSEAAAAAQKIIALAQSCGLELKPIRSKNTEYMRRFDRKHFQALVDAGIATAD